MAHRGAHTPVTVTCLQPVTGLMQAPGPCGSAPPPDESRASSESMSRRMCTTHTSHHADTSSGGPLMGASPTCSSVYMRTCTRGVFRPDGSPPGTIHSLIHTVDKSVYKGSIHSRINVSETASRRPPQSLEMSQRTMATPWSLTAYTGLYQAPQDGMSEQCAKPALARFVTLFRG